MRLRKFCVAALCALAVGPAAAGDFRLTTGFDYSSGKYGETTTTDILYIPFTARYETDSFIYRLTIPYIRISGPGNVVGGGDFRVVTGTGEAPRRTADGLGDIVAAVSYNLVNGVGTRPLVDLTAKIKFGTADEDKGLGTGKNDYSLQVDVLKSFGAASAFGTLGYKRLGDPPDTNFSNVWYGSLGGSYKFTPATSLGLALDLRQAALDGVEPQRELTAYVSHRLTPRYRVLGYAVKGFSDASPDWGGGLMLTVGF